MVMIRIIINEYSVISGSALALRDPSPLSSREKVINSLCTKDRISSPTAHNASVLRTAYAVHAFRNPQQIGHTVCTKHIVMVPFPI